MTFKTADLCDDNEARVQIAQPGFLNYGARARFYGEIVTIKLFEDNSLVREQVNLPGEGRVLVVDGAASMRCALVGDQMASAALENGWNGLLINGCIRDSAEIATMDIGVKALATLPLKSVKRGIGELNVAINFH
ncbi:MAG: ribonuclease E activity regulator RraA, partial [Gammaproteobacteria bacterium]